MYAALVMDAVTAEKSVVDATLMVVVAKVEVPETERSVAPRLVAVALFAERFVVDAFVAKKFVVDAKVEVE
jgi:hypothetical protein